MQGVSAGSVRSIADVLSQRACLTPERQAYAWLHDGEVVDQLTYRALDAKARSIASHLHARGAQGPVLLFYPSGLDFVSAFFGCLYAGLIAVPLYPPGRRRFDTRLAAIMADAQPGFGLTCSSALQTVRDFSAQQAIGTGLEWLATDLLPAQTSCDETWPPANLPSTAYLQYTSGSTSIPKGVMVSQEGLLQTLQDLDRGWLHDANSVMVSWLPLFHDMGLIYGLLQPMHGGFPCYLMEPMSFLQRPLRWLEAISRYAGTHSAAPNFAFDLCVRSIPRSERETLNLSRWKVALNAAEPVRHATLRSFTEAFAPCGFDPLAFCPGYGLAESSLKVSAVRRHARTTVLTVGATALAGGRVEEVSDSDADARVFVGCGVSEIDARIAIVDPSTCIECESGRVGEIWVRSGSAGQGYWQRPKESQQTFGARLTPSGEGPFLRTGDLGFLHRGELFITGRVKDLIIVRGANHYPQDIELTAERCHASLNPGAGAAFAVDVDGEEKLVIAQELSRKGLRLEQSDDIVQTIRTAVAREHDLAVHAVVLLRPASIPKTSSGKIQRSACRSGFEAGTLSVVAQWQEPASAKPVAVAAGAPSVPGFIRPWLIERLAEISGVPAPAIDARAPFAALGIDSLTAVRLSDELGQRLGRSLSPTILFEYPSPDALARHLEQSAGATLAAEQDPAQGSPGEPIAVIGIGCRFPQGPDVETFWRSLVTGVDSVSPAPSGRWSPDELPLPPGHFVDAVDQFDADFFGIAPREAERMDPQQRLLLEVACEAIEDAGLTGLAGSRTGVFIGISTSDYARRLLDPQVPADAYAGTGGALSIAANRLSYCLDLRGPSWAVDTACSSSLVAVHQATQALRLGQCEVALAGGVNVIATPDLTRALGEARMLSADGRCKTFDASADGYGRGEGCGVVVLKRYRDALRDGDRPLALLLGTAVNQDGHSNGLTAPNGQAQQQVIRSALADAGVAPADVGYVEAHGTGTPLGDPIEVGALQAVLAQDRGSNQPCWIGSVKTAIGHLEAAAGIAGLVKTVLALEREELPAHLHLKQLNPHLRLEGTPFSIPTTSQPWPRGARRRIGGVSSFGFGGTNAHVVLAEAPTLPSAPQENGAQRSHHLLTLSAKTPQALAAQARQLSQYLTQPLPPALADLCFTSTARRAHHRYRAAWVTEDLPGLQRQLAEYAADANTSNVRSGQADEAATLAMLFTGQGSQYRDMGLALYRSEPVFRRVVDECDAILRDTLSPSLREVWFGSADEALLHETAYTQPALYTLEIALAQLWRSWGVEPAAVMGHSVGEFAAAAVAGVFSYEDGLKLVAARGRLMQALPGEGLMVAVAADHARVLALLGAHEPRATIAAVNGPRNTVISGHAAAVQAMVERCAREGIGTTPLRTSHAFHSPLMQPMLDAFTEVVAGVQLQPPSIPLISNLTGEAAGQEIATPAYWRRHVSDAVLFAAGMSALAGRGCRTFLEIGPAPVLLGMGRQSLGGDGLAWLPSLRPGVADMRQMLDSLGAWHVRGGPVEWAAFHGDRPPRSVRMPSYPFQRQRYWLPDSRPAPASAVDAYRIEWRHAEATTPAGAAPAAPGCWLILAEPGGLGHALAEALEAQGHRCLRLGRDALAGAPDALGLHATLEAFASETGLPWRGAVQLWSAEARADANPSAQAEADILAALALMRLLARQSGDVPARLWLVTRAAVAVDEAQPQPLRLAGAALWGLGRGLAVEQARHFGGLVDLDTTPQAGEAARLLAELLGLDGETEVAWRGQVRRVPRLVRADALPQAVPTIRPDGCYLITGGCGFVGLEVAAWLVRHGATRLVLSGRRAAPHARIDALRAQGAQVLVVAADVADPADVERLFGEIAASGMPSLRGIIHAAGVGESRPLTELDAPTVAQAMRPKLAGTLLLDARTADMELDFFVCMSSIASVWGGKGVAHYAAANHVLDAWAHDRRARGRPALTLNCGPWAGGGMAFGNDRLGLEHSGITPLAAERYLAALSSLIGAGACQVVLAQVDWSVLRPLYEAQGRGRLLQDLGGKPSASPAPTRPALREKLRTAAPAQRRPMLQEHVRREVATVLGFAANKPFDPTEGFFQLGMDSLTAVELRNRLAAALGQSLPAALVFDYPNVEALTTALWGLLEKDSWAVPAMPPTPVAWTGTAETARTPGTSAEPIAIVGIACRFPGGAHDAQAFWTLQREGVDAIRHVPADRWDADACYDPEGRAPGTAYTRQGGFIDGVDLFDAQYFGISPREAAEMDPQHRLVLEISHEALENAGHAFHAEAAERTGVFLGLTHSDYAQMLLAENQPGRIGPYAVTGSSPNAAAGRVSYALRLKGPALTVDTACSSSLVAVDLACRSLRERECDAALAGGVNLILSPVGTIAACQARMLSADGRCKTFDASADGYGRGEGAGMVVLKRLSDALSSGDRIWAVVLGSAVNHDGRSSGFTVPSGPAQQAVIRAALARAGVAPGDVGYVEAHGTGTALGDPIEAGALGAVFANSHRDSALTVGSVKGNIGHLESAAGIAGLIRAALVVHHGEIPRLPHLSTPNPEIDWHALALRAAQQHLHWSDTLARRIAGVSSFGVSGTNAHAVLAEPPVGAASTSATSRPAHLLALSAKTAEALRALAGALARHLQEQPALAVEDICHTLNGRARHTVRAAWRVASTDEARRALLDCAQGAHAATVLEAPRLCWVFDDAGSLVLHAPAIRELYDTQPVFRQALDALEAPAAALLPKPPAHMLCGEDDALRTDPAWHTALAFALQHALAQMWRSQGVTHDATLVLGSGAWAAACAGGAMTPADALRACVERAAHGVAVQACAAAVPCVGLPAGAAAAAVDAALADIRREGVGLFLEMGIVRAEALHAAGERVLGGRWLGACAPGRSAWEGLVDALAALHLAGAEPQLRGPHGQGRVVTLPTYPFQRRRYWIEDAPGADVPHARRLRANDTPPLPGRRIRSAAARDSVEFAATVSAAQIPFLAEHRIFGTPVLPSSLYLEMALSAAREVLGAGPVSLCGYRIGQAGALDPAQGRELHIVLSGEGVTDRSFEIVGIGSEAAATDGAWTRHAEGRLQRLSEAVPPAPLLESVQARLRRPVGVSSFYELLHRHGLDIGSRFHAVRQLWAGDGDALGEIELTDGLRTHRGLSTEPAVLDACFQLAGAALDSLGAATRAHLQVGIERFTLLSPCELRVWAYLRLRPRPATDHAVLLADLWIYAPDGQPVAIAEGLALSPANMAEAAAPAVDPQRLRYRIEWSEDPASARTPMPTVDQLAAALAAGRDAWQSHSTLADYGVASTAVDALCARLAAQALCELGWPVDAETAVPEAVMQQLGIATRHRRLVQRLLEMRKAQEALDAAVPVDALFDGLRREHPAATAELALLERTSAHLVDVLRGTLDPNDVLFPGGDLTLVTRLYEDSPVAAMMNALVGRAVAEVVAQWPKDRPLRILEIGAGTGATTSAVLPHLSAQRADYVYTDIDDRFLDAASQRFAGYPFVRFERLNIDDDPAGQGIAVGQFDIVIAANVLHTAPRLERSLRHAHQLLAPAGLLILLEGTAPLRLFDLTFGLTEGWWRFADDPARPAYPLVGVEQWRALLEAQGFEGFSHVSSQDPRWPALPLQSVMTAHAARGQAVAAQPGHWLLYGNGTGLGERLAARLRAQGDTTSLVARPGLTQEAYRDDLLRTLGHGAPLRGVIHMSSLDAELTAESDTAALQSAVEHGCRSALALAQALAEVAAGRTTPLWLVTRGAVVVEPGPRLNPVAGLAQAPVWGLGKVLASEHAELQCRLLDLDPVDPSDDAALLLDELQRADAESRVALRGHRRLTARLTQDGPVTPVSQLRADRSYLVTGGFGGIGLCIAQWLAARGARHLVLVGRSGPCAESAVEQSLHALRDDGVNVLALQADIAQAGDVSAVLDRIAAGTAPLAGIVHAAGVFADRLVVDQEWPLFEQVFAPKIMGAWNLHQLTRNLPLEFFAMCSSASTLFGGAGLSNYVAANEFLDALASHRRALGQSGVSIVWGPWSGVGMARHVGDTREAEWRALGLHPLAPTEALAGFAGALGSNAAQVAVMDMDWEALAGHPLRSSVARFVERFSRAPAVRPSHTSARARIEAAEMGERPQLLLEFVRSQVEAVLGWPAGEHVNVKQGFFDLGMDSLQASELRNRLQAALECKLPSTLMFRFPTTAALAQHLQQQLLQTEKPPGTAEPTPAVPPVSTSALLAESPTDADESLQAELAKLEQLLGK